MDRIESWKDRDEINALGEPALVGGEEAIASRAGDLYEGTVVLLLPERGLALGDAEHVAAVQLGAVGGGEDAGPVGYVAAEDAGEDVLAPKVDDAAAVALPVDPLAVVLGDVPHGEGEHAGAVPQPPLEGALVNGAVGLPVHAVAVRQVLLPGPVVLVGLERPRRGGGDDGPRARDGDQRGVGQLEARELGADDGPREDAVAVATVVGPLARVLGAAGVLHLPLAPP